VTTSAGAVSAANDPGDTTLTVVCADGSTHSDSLTDLTLCKAGVPGVSEGCACGRVPNDAGVYTGSFSLTLQGTSDSQGTLIFHCESP
jgi:hypothetical protein